MADAQSACTEHLGLEKTSTAKNTNQDNRLTRE